VWGARRSAGSGGGGGGGGVGGGGGGGQGRGAVGLFLGLFLKKFFVLGFFLCLLLSGFGSLFELFGRGPRRQDRGARWRG
jgi:hypothetical protein